MVRPPSTDKSNVKRRLWTAEEDAKLLAYVSTRGTANWDSVSGKAGLNRCGNGCRRRWLNHLMPDLKHERFMTPQEEEKIVNLHATMGNRWAAIASQPPGRTDTNVKNHWNTKLRKKLLDEGIDPVTHRPISDVIQITGSLPTATTASTSNTSQYHSPHGTRTANVNRGLNNAFLSKSTPIIHPTFPERKPPSMSSNLFLQPCDVSTITTATYASSNEAPSSSTVVPPPTMPELKWSDFLKEDVFLPDDEGESELKSMEGSATVDQNSLVDEWWDAMDGNAHGSSHDGSSWFVDAILDRHQETVIQFPEILDDDIL